MSTHGIAGGTINGGGPTRAGKPKGLDPGGYIARPGVSGREVERIFRACGQIHPGVVTGADNCTVRRIGRTQKAKSVDTVILGTVAAKSLNIKAEHIEL